MVMSLFMLLDRDLLLVACLSSPVLLPSWGNDLLLCLGLLDLERLLLGSDVDLRLVLSRL